jgi:gliding motility-associated lipoprotein GldD
MLKLFYVLPTVFILLSCGQEQLTPKPPTYLRLELPEAVYENHQDDCGYSFQLNNLYSVEKAPVQNQDFNCHRRIQLGKLNGTIFFRYLNMEEPVAFYINNSIDEVEVHQVKATNIKDKKIIRPEDRVFGTVFELQGDVATPFQFYLTDSTDRFIYAEVLFNSRPNYDSLRPSLEYLRQDLDTLLNTFKWPSQQ